MVPNEANNKLFGVIRYHSDNSFRAKMIIWFEIKLTLMPIYLCSAMKRRIERS